MVTTFLGLRAERNERCRRKKRERNLKGARGRTGLKGVVVTWGGGREVRAGAKGGRRDVPKENQPSGL